MLSRLRRRRGDPREEAAQAAYAAGDFAGARLLAAEVVAAGDPSREAVRGLAELEYLLGSYAAAEGLFRQVAEEAGRDAANRVDAETGLALVYLQTNRFAEARDLFVGLEDAIELPIWELMTSFGDEPPYRVDWSGERAATAPFLQETEWELPRIRVEIDGLEVEARIDTGGELLTLSRDVAEALGVVPVVTTQGEFAAGARAEMTYGRVDVVRVGPLTVEGVPVAVVSLEQPVLGTGFLRQFCPTVDCSRGLLTLRPPGSDLPAGVVRVPFALAATHLILVRGSLNDIGPLTFFLDSGLEDEGGASFAAPRATLEEAGIALPELTEVIGESGAGGLSERFGRFPIGRLAVGPRTQENATGLYGIVPEQWEEVGGISLHGLVSHGFLRRYAWTLDFERMELCFETPEPV